LRKQYMTSPSLTLRVLIVGLAISVAGCRHHKEEQLEPPPSISQMTENLRSNDKDDRYEAVRALPQLAAKDKEAMTLLISALSDKDPSVRWVATDGLAKCGAAAGDAVSKLAELLTHDPDATVRYGAAHALSTMQSAGLRALGKLQAAEQKDAEEDVRNEAKRAILTLRAVQKYQSTKPK
jgi:HEAT repeat protein